MNKRPLPGRRDQSKHEFSKRLVIGLGIVIAVALCVLLLLYVMANQVP